MDAGNLNVAPKYHASQINEPKLVKLDVNKVNVSTLEVIRNIFLTIVTLGHWLVIADRDYKVALAQRKWVKVEEAMKRGGAFSLDHLYNLKEAINFIEQGDLKAAERILTMSDSEYSLRQFINEMIQRIHNKDSSASTLLPWLDPIQNVITVFGNVYGDSEERSNSIVNVVKEALLRRDFEFAKKLTNRVDKSWLTPLVFDHRFFNVEYLNFFLECGVNIDVRSDKYRNVTLLSRSIQKNDMKVAKFLIDRGADLEIVANHCDCPGTPLRSAVGKGNVDMVKLLLERGADPHKTMKGTGQMRLVLFRHGGRNDRSDNESSAFDLALKTQQIELIQVFSGHVNEKAQKLIDAQVEYLNGGVSQ